MVTERKGCGLVHAVNGGFSFACGHCARANEPDYGRSPAAGPAVMDSRATDRLAEFAGGLVERIDLSRYGNNLGRVRTPMQDHYESAYASLTARTADHRSQPWIHSELGDVPRVGFMPHPGMIRVMRPDGMHHDWQKTFLDPATVGDTGDWPPLHVVPMWPDTVERADTTPAPLAHIRC